MRHAVMSELPGQQNETMKRSFQLSIAAFCAFVASDGAAEDWRSGYSLYGTPGLIEMPSAFVRPDAEIGMTLGGFENQQRVSFNFQVTPRFSGTFRYSRLAEWGGPGTGDLYDRSFDLHYQALTEGSLRPAVTVGLRDFMGTGVYSGEYLVASKTLSPRLRATLGLGWGRLATEGGFDNPLGVLSDAFDARPALDFGFGGKPSFDQFFRGDAAFFGGAEWQLSDDWVATVEYASDGYARETSLGIVERETPVNFGLSYAPNADYILSAYALGGSDIGFSATLIIDPKDRVARSGSEPAPVPVAVRGRTVPVSQSERVARDVTATALLAEGIVLQGLDIYGRTARVRFENERYRAEAQALGRVARVLTRTMPLSVENFVLEPTRAGLPLSAITIRRSDMEAIENRPNAAAQILDRATVTEAGAGTPPSVVASQASAIAWGLSPYYAVQLFDGSNPLRGEYGLQADLRYALLPNLTLAGTARYRMSENRSDARVSESTLQPVRRNVGLYGEAGEIGIEDLALHWYARPGRALYSRVSVGYLEKMFAGASTELLWKPVDSRVALGAEINYVVQRDYDLGFGAQDFPELDGVYDVVTGHASVYYDFENDFHGRIDVGRYLAGDWGATFALDREFANGWRVGAYATLTDVPFEDFGEGSFDKGVQLTIPLDWAIGTATRDQVDVRLSSLSRDGGARLNVDGRLYETVRGGHVVALQDSWGRFWR
ncbi:Exopolysaccharide biosynthesis protein YbjH [Yoonia rosea]|uniref:Exopolysaccharide biosynthesis protein YbjH n=1 Tax=Yoonia rosea TaxID=287098 RepID=A0A1R3WU58_9RHOB|nr:YjbH domain-containing protein [Yoonia rosea]SIT81530.1 Exopolysaccharide biosynthesis protein YbjH [Yoonia rosea]